MSSEFEESAAGLQRDSQPAASSAESLSPGSPNPSRFQPGNLAAWRHGGRSARVAALELPEQAESKAALADRVAAIVADLGGPEALTALAAGMVERHARLELVDDYLFANVQRLGPLTGKGRTRAALTAWLAVVDRLQKSALALGLERRTKPVNPLDAVRAAVIEANQRQTGGNQ